MKKVVSTKIDPDQYKLLTQMVENLNLSVSGVLRLSISEFLVNHRKTGDNAKSTAEEGGML